MSKRHITRAVSTMIALVLILALLPVSAFACSPKAVKEPGKVAGKVDVSECTCTEGQDVYVNIVWKDNNNAAGKRPKEYVTMQLCTYPKCPLPECASCYTNKQVKLTPGSSWSWKHENLKSADQLTLVAPEVPGYSKNMAKKSGSVIFEVTYTLNGLNDGGSDVPTPPVSGF